MLVQRAKKQYTEFKAGTRRTGGGGIRRPEEWASKICTEVLPTEVVFGIPGGVDTGQVIAHNSNPMVTAEQLLMTGDYSSFVDDRGPNQVDDDGEDLERDSDGDDDDAAEDFNLGHRAAGFIQNEMIESGRQCCSAPPAAYYMNVGQNPPPAFRNKRKMSATSCWELAVTAEEKKFEAETEKLKAEKDFCLAKTKYYTEKLKVEKLKAEKDFCLAKTKYYTEKLKVEKDFVLAKTTYYKLQCEKLERELTGDE